VSVLAGIVCYNEGLKQGIAQEIANRDLPIPVHVRAKWYF